MYYRGLIHIFTTMRMEFNEYSPIYCNSIVDWMKWPLIAFIIFENPIH